MKLKLKRPKNLRKRHKIVVAFLFVVFIAAIAGLLFKVRNAQALAPDANFRVAMPYFGSASQGSDVYLEISQTGNNNSLDAPEAWAKVYIDANRVNDATIGIFRGGYANGVDSEGNKFRGAGGSFVDNNTSKFEFYLGVNRDQDGFKDERPCLDPTFSKDSGDMSADGWYKIDASRFRGKKCFDTPWEPTDKSGKYVIFVRASWKDPNPLADGRLNAFKVGAAYENSAGVFDNPLTGYWSNYTAAVNPGAPRTAAYSVQDRKSPDGTRGDYTFKFAPDCRIPVGETDPKQRYLHWKDVDYPDFYNDGKAAPSFEVIEISPSGKRRTMTELSVNKDRIINGSSAFGQNKHASLPFKGIGGYKYEWTWKNITRVDGVSFWLPYDDYPALTGCGQWNHDMTMKAGIRGGALTENNFEIAGGQWARINLNQFAAGKNAGPDTDIDLTVAASNSPSSGNKSIATTFETISASLGGGSSCNQAPGKPECKSTPFSRVIEWTSLGRLGPAPTYPSSRTDIYADFKVREDAPDGARYCASAIMSPKSNTNLGGLKSRPEQICFVVNNSLKPYLATSGADVHAGDCNISTKDYPLNGKITGQTITGVSKGSWGSYIVSAGNSINNFGSGGLAEGSALTLGKGGYYGSICRPDIKDMEKDLKSNNVTKVIPEEGLNTTYDLSRLQPGDKPYVVQFAGSGRVTGTAKVPVTVYAPNGSITIAGSFGGDRSERYAKDKLPVVGVIARGNILIEPSVSTINAVLYATGTIDTCKDQKINTAAGVAACKTKLTLNGFAMARDFSFKRTTGSNGLNEAEALNFNAAFYLNPPPGTRKPAGAVQYLGERAPLF